MCENIIIDRISEVRSLLVSAGYDAVLIPQSDPHGSEYIADRWQLRRYLSGFTGSAGDLVVTTDKAALWVDSRYWLQAAQQLKGTGIVVMEEGKATTPDIVSWLSDVLPEGSSVVIDSAVVSVSKAASLAESFSSAGLSLSFIPDLSEKLWPNRPSLPCAPVKVYDAVYAGESAASKISKLLLDVAGAGFNALFMADLAEIAWTLNIRGEDISCNPVVISYLYLSDSLKVWFVDERKLSPVVRAYLATQGVITASYDVVSSFLSKLPADLRIAIDASRVPKMLSDALGGRAVSYPGTVALLKACRNNVEVEGIYKAMVLDGVAMVNAFFELDQKLERGERVTEIDVADLLEKERSKQPGFVCLSFETIAGFADHGAIVHYSATPESASDLKCDNLLLVDSGASYLCGTTDITRTFSLGGATPGQRTDFTLVLKGMIDLARAVFPKGTRGAQLDVLARAEMWRHGALYLHGTGHGVGHCLNVHEGPQSIRLQENPVVLLPGMVTSDEPGIYRAGKYGIRCENLLLCVEAFSNDMGEFLKFETLTLYPFDISLVDPQLLDRWEIEWLNSYQRRVYEMLAPHLDSDVKRRWLDQKCSII